MRGFKFKTFLMLILVIILTFGATVTAFAATAEEGKETEIQDFFDNKKDETIPQSVKKYFKIDNSAGNKYDDSYEFYTHINKKGDTDTYYIKKKDIEQAKKAINIVIKREQASGDLENIVGELDVGADTETATGLLDGFSEGISTVLGFVVIVVSAGTTLFTAIDICYISFPVFRTKCEEAKQTGQGIMVSNKVNKATGENKLRFISDDAQYAIVNCTVENGKNPYITYFGKRIVSYIVLTVLMFILLSGNITVITSLTLRLVSGVLDLIGNF